MSNPGPSIIRFTPPRPLTERERSVLDFLLSVDFPGVEELREQAKHVLAEAKLSYDPTIHLVVDHEKAKPAKVVTTVPVEANSKVSGPDLVSILLFVHDGWLSSLELVWYEENIPDEFPAPEELEPPLPRQT